MSEKTCVECKSAVTYKTGSISHFMFDKEIKIHNVPYFSCECGKSSSYIQESKIETILFDSYLSGSSEREYA